MRSFLAKFWPIIVFTFLVIFFFKPFLFEGKLPIPSDTIVGMYHPWRDFYAKEYPNGIPFKNFLITDPVRQQYVWRNLVIDLLKYGQWPLWNPYQFAGTPLLGNLQSAPFYPLNILFFILPFNLAWGILILLEPLLAGIFLYFYLQNLRLDKFACLLGSLVFSFSGFFIAWLEWGTVLHSALWLPLILLSIDKIIENRTMWSIIFVFALLSSFFAGHLQVFFYLTLTVFFYVTARLIQVKLARSSILPSIILFTILGGMVLLVTSIQWLPTLQFISLSARTIDQINRQQPGWFIPWQNLVQFLAPDFFGNPATLNYWGEWNYGEFVGYIGVIPLIFALWALFRRDKKVWFFGSVAFFSLMFALPTPLAKLPYKWWLPLISTSQPTRLLFLTDFSLSILAALGLDWFLKNLNWKKFIKTILPFGVFFLGLWLFVFFGQNWFKTVTIENLSVAKRNLILPTALLLTFTSVVIVYYILIYHIRATKFSSAIRLLFMAGILFLVIFDLFRFGLKFTPFTKEEWLFPETPTIEFLKNQPKPFRFMTTDRKIFPPNFATFYKLEDVSGYDPLYLKSYAELVAAWNRGKPDISPFSFNRILTPQDYSSRIADLLNVKYVLSLKDEISPKLKLVFQEGQTRVYENKNVYPRAFLVYDYKIAKNKQEAIDFLFDENINLQKTAILDNDLGIKLEGEDKENEVEIVSYEAQKIVLKTKSLKPAILVLADNAYSKKSFAYPGWQAFLDGKEESEKTFRVDFTLRGIIVPEGEHQITFTFSL